MNDLVVLEDFSIKDVEPIELSDGSKLTQQQSAAIILRVVHGIGNKEVADLVGYASGSVVYELCHRDRGREACQIAIKRFLNESAALGLRTMVELASKAKSETVRQAAAADLMDRAGLKNVEGVGSGNNNIQINIDLGG